MAKAKYDSGLASACYINISEEGVVVAGMILENGEMLTATLPSDKDRAEAERKTTDHCPPHKLILERRGDTTVRHSSFFGAHATIEDFSAEIPRGKDYWLGGSRLEK